MGRDKSNIFLEKTTLGLLGYGTTQFYEWTNRILLLKVFDPSRILLLKVIDPSGREANFIKKLLHSVSQ